MVTILSHNVTAMVMKIIVPMITITIIITTFITTVIDMTIVTVIIISAMPTMETIYTSYLSTVGRSRMRLTNLLACLRQFLPEGSKKQCTEEAGFR